MGGVNGDDGLLGYLQPVADQADAVDVLAPIALHADGSFALRADVVVSPCLSVADAAEIGILSHPFPRLCIVAAEGNLLHHAADPLQWQRR